MPLMPFFSIKTLSPIMIGAVWIIGLSVNLAVAQENKTEVLITVLQGSLSKTDTAALTLQEALTIAQAENPIHKAAVAEVRSAKARYLNRLSLLLPDFAISQSFVNLEGSVQSVSTSNFLRANLTSYQPQLLFRFAILPTGVQILSAKIAKKELESQRQVEQFVLQDALRQTGLAYYDLQRRLQDVVIAQQQIAETQANLTLNQSRLASGAGTKLDVLQSQTQLIEAQTQYVEAVQDSETAALRLNELLNLSAFIAVVPSQTNQNIRTLVPATADFKMLLSQALEQNPRIKALNKRIESLSQLFRPTSIAIALAPQFFIQYRTGQLGPTPQFNKMARFDERSYSVGFTYFGMGFTAATRYQEYRGEIARLRALRTAEKNALTRQLSAAWIASKAKRVQLVIAQRQLAVAEETIQAALAQLKLAQSRNIDVFTAQTNLNLARLNLNETMMEYNQAQVELVYGLGLASVATLTQGVPLP